jgi:hypothetical protein
MIWKRFNASFISSVLFLSQILMMNCAHNYSCLLILPIIEVYNYCAHKVFVESLHWNNLVLRSVWLMMVVRMTAIATVRVFSNLYIHIEDQEPNQRKYIYSYITYWLRYSVWLSLAFGYLLWNGSGMPFLLPVTTFFSFFSLLYVSHWSRKMMDWIFEICK